MKRIFATGAMPPSENAWMVGKTVASIRFVAEATKALETIDCMRCRMRLLKAIDAIKAGELTLTESTSPEEYLG